MKNENLSNSDIIRVRGFLNENPKTSLKKFLTIIKSKSYPDRSRWLSLIMVGKAMGKKSAPLMLKYLEHPNWMIRSAAVKSLKSLKVKANIIEYKKLLSDRSYVIRTQALDLIATLNLRVLKLDVLKMLGDQTNYIKTKNGNRPSEVVKKVISTLGILKVKESVPLLMRLQKSSIGSAILGDIDNAIKQISL